MAFTGLAPDIEPWFRQPGEPESAFTAFRSYRDMGLTRTTRAVAEQLELNHGTVASYSARFLWRERVAAYDRYEDAMHVASQMRLRREAMERQGRVARLFQSKVVERLQTLDPKELSPSQLGNWFEMAARVERISLGGADATISHVNQQSQAALDSSNPQHLELARNFLERLSEAGEGDIIDVEPEPDPPELGTGEELADED